MNIRDRLRILAPTALAVSLLAGLPATATAAPAATSSARTAVTESAATTKMATAGAWYWQGWYPDPALCAIFGASTGRPFECRYTFPWSWDLYVWI